MSDTTFIYTLSCPFSGDVRYVGKSNNPHERYKLHLKDKSNTHKAKWIASIRSKGALPVIEVLDVVPSKEWQFWECHWIQVFKGWGFSLTNGDNGGLGTDRLPSDVKLKISKSLSGKKPISRFKAVHQYTLDGKYIKSFDSVTDASNDLSSNRSNLIRAAKRLLSSSGYRWSYIKHETLPAMPQKVMTDEAKMRIAAANTGKRASAETRLKQRLKRLGKSPANKGKKVAEKKLEDMRLTSSTRKPVCQYSLEGQLLNTYTSIKHASLVTGATRAGILNTCNGEQSSAAGYLWKRP